MRITSIECTAEHMGDIGLEPIHMQRLGRKIVLAGPNGGGKTRLLSYIEKNSQLMFEAAKDLKRAIGAESIPIDEEIEQLFFSKVATDPAKWRAQRKLKNPSSAIRQWLDGPVVVAPPFGVFVPFVPKDLILQDDLQQTRASLHEAPQLLRELGFDTTADNAAAYVQSLQDDWIEATHSPNSMSEPEEAIARYESLAELLKRLLGCPIERRDRQAHIFGLRIGDAKLSDGQRVLLQFAIALHSQGTELESAVLVMDEPENHLHPAALVEVVQRIESYLTSGQLWIATHSVHLLAQADVSEIWYVDAGRVRHAGRRPEVVLSSLLGAGEDVQHRLREFISLPAQFGSNRFAAECLLPPGVADPRDGDDQMKQFREVIRASRQDDRPLRILDIGAGKGRLLAALIGDSDDPRETATCFDYIAFDTSDEHRSKCEDQLARAYNVNAEGPQKERYFCRESALFAGLDPNSIDVAVMCNVLHEIEPHMWPQIFGAQGLVGRLVRPDGHILIIEDQRIPVGEKAHQKGFLLLDEPQLRCLFGLRESERYKARDERGDQRLKAHLVPAKYAHRVTGSTVKAALQNLQQSAKEEIRRLRDAPPSYANGSLHGLWVQQYANCALALEDWPTS